MSTCGGGVWLYFATGNNNYLSLATDPSIYNKINDKAFNEIPYLKILSWDYKLPAAMLLLTRMMRFHKFGRPNEEMLSMYHISIGLTTTGSCLHQFKVVN
jgi:endoglucanase